MKLKFVIVKKILVSILLSSLIFSKSVACEILNVPIETPVEIAVQKFDFLDTYDEKNFEPKTSVIYDESASDYCSSGGFKNTTLEVMIFESKVALIKLTSPKKNQLNEVYKFTRDFIQDPGDESQQPNWTGFVDLSVGNLLVWYSRAEQLGYPFETLEITNANMEKYIEGEHVEEDLF
ncbi:hypothetical protein [Candidatus Pelagibacter sp.]|uniref:hypothetical protein n=1 Tax=Candidatus Pelagibacter sp. TaxID=2024849 RepID=UPI003F86B024|tara:strand:+ start:181 stop:714 length:534 start_codon:yes stop_codon:yes gene_type:complete